MILWHRTSKAAAESIFRNGFQDAHGTYMTGREHSGVWLSGQPLDSNEGACGDVLLRVNLACTEGEIADYEWIGEGKGYREWLIPAVLLNRRAKISRRPDPLRQRRRPR
jgi:hypothetical protein